MPELLLVALGAALGAPLRHLAGLVLDRRLPWGTAAVNWAGSALLGTCSGLGAGGAVWALVGVGFCGALTTYSGFAVQVHAGLARAPRTGAAVVLLTVVPSLLLCAAGFWVGATVGPTAGPGAG